MFVSLPIIIRYRKILPGSLKDSPVMGNLMVTGREGEIRVGDPVYVTRGVIDRPEE